MAASRLTLIAATASVSLLAVGALNLPIDLDASAASAPTAPPATRAAAPAADASSASGRSTKTARDKRRRTGDFFDSKRSTRSSATSATRWKPRPEQFASMLTMTDIRIPMSDGVTLSGTVSRPANKAGLPVAGRFPVIVSLQSYTPGTGAVVAAGGNPEYLVKRGYVQVNVDTRGTGGSGGSWCALCTREQQDGAEVVRWVRKQPWSNGASGLTGTSYGGINQVLAAGQRPPGLKAIFPVVPAGDVYRDVAGTGGAFDVSFIGIWATLMIQSQITPSATARPGFDTLANLVQHALAGVGGFTLPWFVGMLAGSDKAYDGRFYQERSPINSVGRVSVPTFLIGGERDIFQRGTPLLFENLVRRRVPVKMLFGPWNHSEAATSKTVATAGHGTIEELQLRWFDRYVKGRKDTRLNRDIAPLNYFEQGTNTWRRASGWMNARSAASFKFSGSAITGGGSGTLTTGTTSAGKSTVLPVPLAGLCSRSTDQWTAGLLTAALPANCLDDQSMNDKTGIVFRTAPLKSPLAFQGPMNVRLYASSSTGDGLLSVAVEDEAPDGTVNRLSAGWQLISHRALNGSKSRYLGGKLIQPYHPHTKETKKRTKPGEVVPVDVEIFPTGAQLLPGHRLRIAIQSFDAPHLLPMFPDLLNTLGVVTIHSSPRYSSVLTLPVVSRR